MHFKVDNAHYFDLSDLISALRDRLFFRDFETKYSLLALFINR